MQHMRTQQSRKVTIREPESVHSLRNLSGISTLKLTYTRGDMSTFCRRRDGYGGFVDDRDESRSGGNRGYPIYGRSAAREGQCICQRPRQIIFCHSCSHQFQGHLAYKCPKHNHVYLMDVEACPKCHSLCLSEICDAPTPPNQYRRPADLEG